MSLAKVSKQLKRELKANPTKAAALGVLTVVAAVFWGPLLFKSDEKPKKPAAGLTAAAPASVGSTAEARPQVAIDWRTLAKGLAGDSRMKSPAKNLGATAANPFSATTPQEDSEAWLRQLVEASGASENAAPAAAQPDPPDFDRLPLQLTTTFVGPRMRKAVINGKARDVGSEIEQFNGGPIVLAEVAPRYAVVEWNGKRRELKIPKPGEQPPPDAAPAGAAGSEEAVESSGSIDPSELPDFVREALGR